MSIGMEFREVTITPEMAETLLSKNARNRVISKHNVDMMVKDIKNGKYELTHEAIAIAEDGSLVDGQHRLMAIKESGIPVKTMICYNAVRSTKINKGVKRTPRQSLLMSGLIEKESMENNPFTQSLIRTIITFTSGQKAAGLISDDDLHDIYAQYSDDLFPILETVAHKKSMTWVPTKSAIFMYCLLCAYKSGCPLRTIQDFYEIVRTGSFDVDSDVEKTRAKSSVLLYINYARGLSITARSSSDRVEEFIKKTMSSLKHYEKGETIRKLYGEYCYPMYKITKWEKANGREVE